MAKCIRPVRLASHTPWGMHIGHACVVFKQQPESRLILVCISLSMITVPLLNGPMFEYTI